MKTSIYISALAFVLVIPSFGGPFHAGNGNNPRLDTVEKCRAYREAWNASADEDIKNLTVRQLLDRSEQMINCARRVDVNPIKPEMTPTSALDVLMGASSYAILSSAYQREVIARLTAFLERKRLLEAFILQDETNHSAK